MDWIDKIIGQPTGELRPWLDSIKAVVYTTLDEYVKGGADEDEAMAIVYGVIDEVVADSMRPLFEYYIDLWWSDKDDKET